MPKAAKKPSTRRQDPLSTTSGNAQKRLQDSTTALAVASKAASTALDTNSAKLSNAKSSAVTTTRPDSADEGNYLLLVTLLGTDNPLIQRLLTIPSTFTFAQLHQTLQIAFGWSEAHMHTFHVRELRDPSVRHSMPFPRQVLSIVSSKMNIRDLAPEVPEVLEHETTLAQFYLDPVYANKTQVTYEYDMGDGWAHEIVFLGRAASNLNAQLHAPKDVQVLCLSGQGHGAAEDAGGVGGWEHLKALFTNKRMRDEDDRKGWYKKECHNGDPKGLEPWKWDLLDVNDDLFEAFESAEEE